MIIISKKYYLFIIYLMLIALLIFGKHYSKFKVAGPLFLYDLTLIIIFLFSFLFINKSILNFRLILVLFLISLLYLFQSLFINKDYSLIIRQYAMFGYLGITYFFFNFLINYYNINYFTNKFERIAKTGFFIQFFYFLYLFFSKKINLKGYFYWSPLCVMALISYSAYILIYKKKLKKIFYYLITLFVSFSTGHSSAVLSILILPFVFGYINLNKIYKSIIIIFMILFLFILFVAVPSFHDANAMWRIYYWYMAWKNILIKHYGIFGNGFGVPYADENTIYILQILHHATLRLDKGVESYLIPFHNSFLTIFFHIGFIPGLIIFYPYYKFIKNYKLFKYDIELKFLFLSLIGISVWTSFNVILELPHSSLFFWVNYFLLLFKMKIKLNEIRMINEKNIIFSSTTTTSSWSKYYK